MAKQNAMAYEYLVANEQQAIAAGFMPPSPFESLLEMNFSTAQGHLDSLKQNDTLPQLIMNDALEMNKDARRAYDQVLAGKKAFAARFGSASEPLISFDQKFMPNEGWKVFFEHF